MCNLVKQISFIFFCFCCLCITPTAADPQLVIGFPEDNMSNDWRAAQMNEIEKALLPYTNIRFLMADAAGSIAKNILDIEEMVDQGVQLLFLGPKNPEALKPVIGQLRKKGIYIVLLTRKLSNDDYDVFISPNDVRIAHDAAQFMARHIGARGRILMLEGVPTTTTAQDRRRGFVTAIEQFEAIEIVSRVANYSRADAIAAVEKLLKQGEKFDAIYAHNDAMAAGARFALQRAGIDPASIPTVGIDFLPEAREAILKGEQLASFTYPTCGKMGVDVALKLLQGKKVPRYIEVSSQLVTRKNVNNISTAY
ncbi:MAG: substrate-binding domain-containing protein [Gammaproteobacteria bacterium]|nr:substrate-binding domain-containing protein [Gammaproteobacteria bacterium]